MLFASDAQAERAAGPQCIRHDAVRANALPTKAAAAFSSPTDTGPRGVPHREDHAMRLIGASSNDCRTEQPEEASFEQTRMPVT